VLIVLAHDRRRILHFNVTEHPTAQWSAQQLVEAFPWETAPQYLLRDRDGIYGPAFVQQSRAWAWHRRSRPAESAVKSICGAPLWEHAAGVPRPRDCLQRESLSRRSGEIRCVLASPVDAHIVGHGLSRSAGGTIPPIKVPSLRSR
jgi:hypothetical protein